MAENWICPDCKKENPTRLCYCAQCGKPRITTELVCPKCGEINNARVHFCRNCGINVAGVKTQAWLLESDPDIKDLNVRYTLLGLSICLLWITLILSLLTVFETHDYILPIEFEISAASAGLSALLLLVYSILRRSMGRRIAVLLEEKAEAASRQKAERMLHT